jgi:hypothetical protein
MRWISVTAPVAPVARVSRDAGLELAVEERLAHRDRDARLGAEALELGVEQNSPRLTPLTAKRASRLART